MVLLGHGGLGRAAPPGDEDLVFVVEGGVVDVEHVVLRQDRQRFGVLRPGIDDPYGPADGVGDEGDHQRVEQRLVDRGIGEQPDGPAQVDEAVDETAAALLGRDLAVPLDQCLEGLGVDDVREDDRALLGHLVQQVPQRGARLGRGAGGQFLGPALPPLEGRCPSGAAYGPPPV
ncbi:hypothetical protein [Kitasatospora sp. NPDC005856]|uniref:hypothetical protein n=1 Tax=Kitasatospora sp. NPDC005856 TaxID=3154566 RepID=UPI0033E3D488